MPSIKQLRRHWLYASIGTAAIVVVASVAIAQAGDDGHQGGESVRPGVAQDAVATSGGFEFTATRAEFSGTGTFIELRVTALDASNDPGEVHILTSDFATDSVQPLRAGGDLTLHTGEAAIVRLRPLEAAQQPKLEFRGIAVPNSSGALARITGRWHLDLDMGGNRNDLLWTELLGPGRPVNDQGITIRPISAARSRTETLITVGLDGPEGLGQLASPTMMIDGRVAYGARINELSPESRYEATFTFPSTPRGSPVSVAMGPFVVPGRAGVANFVDIGLKDVLQRQGVTGEFNDKAIVDPGDIRKSDPHAPDVIEVTFARTDRGQLHANVLNVAVAGTFDDAGSFRLQLPDGEVLSPTFSRSGYSVSPSGALHEGATLIGFAFNRFEDLLGDVRLTIGNPSTIVQGSWQVEFGTGK